MLQNGQPDTVAIIHVVYENPEEYSERPEEHNALNVHNKKKFRIPLTIRIVPHSRYRATHLDYNFELPDCPTKESIENSKSTPKPIALTFDDFSYDHQDKIFYNKENTSLSGSDLLEIVYKKHCDTVHLIKGLTLRFKLRSHLRLDSILTLTVNALIKSLSLFFGRTLDDSDIVSTYFSGYKKGGRLRDVDAFSAFLCQV